MGKISAATIVKRTARSFDSYITAVAYSARRIFKVWVKPFLKRRGLILDTFPKVPAWAWWAIFDKNARVVAQSHMSKADKLKLDADLQWIASILDAPIKGHNAPYGSLMPSYHPNTDTEIEHD